MKNETITLEEALANLARPEVRASLETYVPASYELFHDHLEAYDRGIIDIAHALVDMEAKEIQAYRPNHVEFLHGLVDIIGKKPGDREPDKIREEHKKKVYQFVKNYVHENYDVAKVVEARAEAFYERLGEMSEKEKDRCDLNPSLLENILNFPSRQIKVKMMAKLGELPWVPYMDLGIGNYINAMRKYITEETGQELKFSNPDTDLIANFLLPYMKLRINEYNCGCEPLERIYKEAVQEIPGLKDKIVGIGRKYGVEIKTD